mgnify:CR=1 FL=1
MAAPPPARRALHRSPLRHRLPPPGSDPERSSPFDAPSPRRVPRGCPLDNVGRRGLSFGQIDELATRPLPFALPVGAPLDNVGTRGTAPKTLRTSQHCQERHPAEGKRTARPHEALSSACRSPRLPDTPGGVLPTPFPVVVTSLRSVSVPLWLSRAGGGSAFICVICGSFSGWSGGVSAGRRRGTASPPRKDQRNRGRARAARARPRAHAAPARNARTRCTAKRAHRREMRCRA